MITENVLPGRLNLLRSSAPGNFKDTVPSKPNEQAIFKTISIDKTNDSLEAHLSATDQHGNEYEIFKTKEGKTSFFINGKERPAGELEKYEKLIQSFSLLSQSTTPVEVSAAPSKSIEEKGLAPIQNINATKSLAPLKPIEEIKKPIKAIESIQSQSSVNQIDGIKALPSEKSIEGIKAQPSAKSIEGIKAIPSEKSIEGVKSIPPSKPIEPFKSLPPVKAIPPKPAKPKLNSNENVTTQSEKFELKNTNEFHVSKNIEAINVNFNQNQISYNITNELKFEKQINHNLNFDLKPEVTKNINFQLDNSFKPLIKVQKEKCIQVNKIITDLVNENVVSQVSEIHSVLLDEKVLVVNNIQMPVELHLKFKTRYNIKGNGIKIVPCKKTEQVPEEFQ